MVQNDLENIPQALVVMWACVITFYLAQVMTPFAFVMHNGLVGTFVVCRVLYSIFYAYGMAIPRSISFLIGVVASFGLLLNCGYYIL